MDKRFIYQRRYGLVLAIKMSEILDIEPVYIGNKDIMYQVGPVKIMSNCEVKIDEKYFYNDVSRYQEILSEIGVLNWESVNENNSMISMTVLKSVDKITIKKIKTYVGNNWDRIVDVVSADIFAIEELKKTTVFHIFNELPSQDNFRKAYFFINEITRDEFDFNDFECLLEALGNI